MELNSVIDRYFAAIRGKDIDALMLLYADDATFILPNGQEHAGREAIRAMHLHVFASGAPFPSPSMRIIGDGAGAVEIEARLANGTLRRTTNHYTVDGSGRIKRLNVYMKTG
jgi:uncharacterized protein (TIGR02246 family)